MSLHPYRLSLKVQLYYVFTYDTFLAQRWEGKEGVHLYHLPSRGRLQRLGNLAFKKPHPLKSGFSNALK